MHFFFNDIQVLDFRIAKKMKRCSQMLFVVSETPIIYRQVLYMTEKD